MTEKLYYFDSYIKEFDAEITKIIGDEIYLDRTAFYPEGGGQPSDKGKIKGKDFEVSIESVVKKGDEIAHKFKPILGNPKIGKVHCEIDWKRRYDFMQQHTGHHILASSIKKILNADVFGSVIFEDSNKVEFRHDDPRNQIDEIERLSNEIVWSAIPVISKFYSKENLNINLRKKPNENLKSIRIVKIGDFDAVPCGGTHVKNTSEVGVIKITSVYKKTKNVWRIEFSCGFRVLNYFNKILKDYNSSRDMLNSKQFNLSKDVENVLKDLEELRKRVSNLKLDITSNKVKEKNGICYYIGDMDNDFMESLGIKLIEKYKIVVLASERGYMLIMKRKDVGLDIKKIMNDVIKKFGGGGGGSPTLVRAGGIENIRDAFDFAIKKVME